MLGDLGSASDATATAIEPFNEAGGGGDGGVGSNSGEDMEEKSSYGRGGGGGGGGGEEFGERSFGGNRWPPQETLALLKIRSDMDVAFRDASVKGPLWDEVSRKLAGLGYHRGAKKCKEKFENVYKYHRRTKEGRTGKSDGKTYRFFDQLRALENQPPATTPMTTANFTTTTAMATLSNPQVNSTTSTTTYPSPHQGIATTIPTSIFPNTSPIVFSSPPPLQPPPPQQDTTFAPPSFPSLSSTDLMSNLTSSSTSSDDEMEGRAKRKRKLKDFFDTLMKKVVKKQEVLQRRFLETVENREKERMAREEAWRMQEMNRIHREREILAQERSVAAAKDVAVMSFLQNLAEQQQQQQKGPTSLPAGNYFTTSVTPSTQQVITPSPPPPPPPPQKQIPSPIMSFEITPRANNGDEMIIHNNDNNNGVASPISTTTNTTPTTMSSPRWPKEEVHSLIKIRTSLDSKYQENGPKGPLWEEISAGMKRLGYNRNPKRCKEKWENINKYFKKVKESNKKRPEDSKTCPYFHLLDSLYRERNNNNNNIDALANAAAPMMVRPEQQWQPPPPRVEGEMEHNPNEDEGEEDEGEEEDEEDEGSYEMVANKTSGNPVSAE